LFNLKNKEAVVAGTEKPNLEERGPYKYQEFLVRSKIVWSDDGNTVSYTNLKRQVYVEDKQYLVFEIDPITLPSIDYAKAMYKAEEYGLSGDAYYLMAETQKYMQKVSE
tara:strand:+ start:757 stop:1083 length:327 start_codon:yes stop_codon:yes gene_type:complete